MSAVAPELPGARVLDLFAGSGALGLEALSRGAEHATFVENAPSALRVLQTNLAALGASERSTIVRTDALRYVRALDALSFDLAFADPPYAKGIAAALVEVFLERPFAGLLCVEHRRTDPLPEAPGARERRYGDTQLTFIPAPS
jgi:16S rRNA (guanine966-N2)-methyltransferase